MDIYIYTTKANDKWIDRLASATVSVLSMTTSTSAQGFDSLVEFALELGVFQQIHADMTQFHHVVRAVVLCVVHETFVVRLE